MEPVIVKKRNITQRASGRQVSNFERMCYPRVLCNKRYHICILTIMVSANIVQVEKLEGRENFAIWNFVR